MSILIIYGKNGGVVTLQRIFILIFCLLLFVFLISRSNKQDIAATSEIHTRYGIMLDAGSTGSRIHIYHFEYTADGAQVLSEIFKQVKPGLSSYRGKPDAAAQSLTELLDIAKEAIPRSEYACTPIVLKATAGLRMLPGTESEDILDAVEALLRDSGFFLPPNSVEIMDGADEGIFAWITVNFLLGRLGRSEKLPTVAIMDLGGGSTQIVFEPKSAAKLASAPKENQYSLNFGNFNYRLYQHSYLGYGLMEARNKIREVAVKNSKKTSCLPFSFVDEEHQIFGMEAKHDSCHHETKPILNKKAQCQHQTCSFNGVFQPHFTDFPSELYAFSYFYDRTETMETPFPELLKVKHYLHESKKFCGTSLETIEDHLKDTLQENPYICFDLNYLYALLNEGYSIPDESNLYLAKKIKGYETGWCLGAMMKVLEENPLSNCVATH